MLFALLSATVGMVTGMFCVQVKTRRSALHTFVVDPPTMFVAGLLAAVVAMASRKGREELSQAYSRRVRWLDRALVAFFVGFWCMELLSYYDVLGHPFDPTRTGNEFMWNGYLDFFGWRPFTYDVIPRPGDRWFHLFSVPWLALNAIVQWQFLRLGRAIGLRMRAPDVNP